MNFTYTQEQLELQSVARDFANKEMVSVAAEMEKQNMPLPKEWLKRYSKESAFSTSFGSLHAASIEICGS